LRDASGTRLALAGALGLRHTPLEVVVDPGAPGAPGPGVRHVLGLAGAPHDRELARALARAPPASDPRR